MVSHFVLDMNSCLGCLHSKMMPAKNHRLSSVRGSVSNLLSFAAFPHHTSPGTKTYLKEVASNKATRGSRGSRCFQFFFLPWTMTHCVLLNLNIILARGCRSAHVYWLSGRAKKPTVWSLTPLVNSRITVTSPQSQLKPSTESDLSSS